MVSHEERIQVIHSSPYSGMNIDYRVVGENKQGVFPGTWFLYDVDPLPEYEELIKIISDCEREKPKHYCGPNGIISHKESCNRKHDLNPLLTRAAVSLKPKVYRIAMWLGNDVHRIPDDFRGHPVIIVLNEDISRYSHPFHCCLNKMFSIDKYYMPESICHRRLLEDKDADKNLILNIENSIHSASEWLMKFRIWQTCSVWLGEEMDKIVIDDDYLQVLAVNRKQHKKIYREIRKVLSGESVNKSLISNIV